MRSAATVSPSHFSAFPHLLPLAHLSVSTNTKPGTERTGFIIDSPRLRCEHSKDITLQPAVMPSALRYPTMHLHQRQSSKSARVRRRVLEGGVPVGRSSRPPHSHRAKGDPVGSGPCRAAAPRRMKIGRVRTFLLSDIFIPGRARHIHRSDPGLCGALKVS